jgi:HSP20 family protein
MATPQTNNGNSPNASAGQQAPTRRAPEQSSMPVRYDPFDMAFEAPFSLMRRMTQDMDRFFNDMLSGRGASALRRAQVSERWSPAIDVFERDNELVIHADVPGLRKEDLKIEVSEGQLHISGERRNESQRYERGMQVSERSYGRFSRTIPLPTGINSEDVLAKFENGVLEIEVPLPTQQQRRRVEVH